jgi:hypothetical protein
MQTSLKLLAISLATATLLAACGGSDSPANQALNNNNNGAAGAVTGNIASLAGEYAVTVSKADCDTEDAGVKLLADGACEITSTSPAGTVVEKRRDILPPGAYTLKVTADGALEMLQGTASKVKINCPAGGTCRVDGSIYTLAGAAIAGAGANIALSQIIFSGKTVTVGSLYGIGSNATFTGTSPLLTNESGILVIEGAAK